MNIKTVLFTITIFSLFCPPLQAQQKPPVIGSITFSGNDYFSSAQLLNMGILKKGMPFSQDQFDLDIKNILKNYQQEGFLNCKIDKIEKEFNFDSTSVSLQITLTEGSQILIGELGLEGNKLFATAFLKDKMYTKPGKVLDSRALNQDIVMILGLYEAKGFPFASVTVKEIESYTEKEKERLRIKIKIDENEKIKIDKILIEGNTSTNEKVITREIRLGNSRSITRETLFDIKQRLENLGFFQSVELPKILKYKSSTVLLIKVTEGNTNTFDGIIGYVPPPTDNDKGYFTGLVNLSLRNLFGTGRKVEARFQKEVKSTQEIELKYFEPWILGQPLNADIGFLQRIEDTLYVKRTLNLRAEALLTRNFSVSALGNLERVIPTTSDNPSAFTPVFDSRLLATGIEIKYDSRDYVYNPLKGLLYKTGYTIGQKKIYNASSYPAQNIPPNFTVQKYSIDLEFFSSFFKRQSSLLGVHGAEIKSPKFDNADYFRFGGAATVRGYRDNQFLASRIIWSNIELRYSLSRKTFASAFYDLGYYRKPADNLANSPLEQAFIYGYGIGIRIETGLGIFGVSYALGKGDSFLEGKVHFGIINDF